MVSTVNMNYRQGTSRFTVGFTLVEVVVALSVAVLFGAAAFATNQRLLIALRSQRESAAATMMLQERMESLRSLTFTQLTDQSYIGSNIINTATTSEAPLGSMSETITISAYPADGTTNNRWVRNPTVQQTATNTTLGTGHGGTQTLAKADILVTWSGPNSRSRSRQLSAVFGIGNLGP